MEKNVYSVVQDMIYYLSNILMIRIISHSDHHHFKSYTHTQAFLIKPSPIPVTVIDVSILSLFSERDIWMLSKSNESQILMHTTWEGLVEVRKIVPAQWAVFSGSPHHGVAGQPIFKIIPAQGQPWLCAAFFNMPWYCNLACFGLYGPPKAKHWENGKLNKFIQLTWP